MYTQNLPANSLKPCVPAGMQKPTASCGAASVRLPAMELYRQCERKFVRAMLKTLWQRPSSSQNLERQMQESALDHVALSLDEFFGGTVAPMQELELTRTGLTVLAAFAEELVTGEGTVANWKPDLTETSEQAIENIERRINEAVAAVLTTQGDQTAALILNAIQQSIDKHVSATRRQIPEVTVEDQATARRAVEELQGMAEPRDWYHRGLIRYRPQLSATHWLNLDELDNAMRHSQMIDDLAFKVYERARLQEMVTVWERLLQDGSALRGWYSEIQNRRAFRRQLIAQIELYYDDADLPAAEHEILVVKDIQEPLSPDSDRTFEQLQQEKLAAAGCTEDDLAARIWDSGLTIDHEVILPGLWFKHAPATVANAILTQHVGPYLGSDQLEKPIDLMHPQSAMEHVLTLTLRDPALRKNVVALLRRACDLSQPYIDLKRTPALKYQKVAYLFCYPKDRQFWFERFKNQPEAAHAKTAFAIDNPYEVILVQYAFGAAGGCLTNFQRGNYLGKRRHHAGDSQPWMTCPDNEELRWVAERPDDYLDCKAMFQSLLKANEIKRIPHAEKERYAPAVPERHIQGHFHEHHWQRTWLTARSVQRKLRESAFVNFVELAFSQEPKFTLRNEWQEFCVRLAQCSDPQEAAEALVDQGILESMEGQRFRLAIDRPSDLPHMPPALYHRTRGVLKGLTSEEFTGLLHRDDRFYNWAFWCVVDAVAEKRLTAADVPVYMVHFLKQNIDPDLVPAES